MSEMQKGPGLEPAEMFAIVDLLGRRRIGGKIQEATIAGASFLRIDYNVGGEMTTIFVSPGSIYSINPVSEAVAMAFRNQVEPVNIYEIKRDRLIDDRSLPAIDGGSFNSDEEIQY